jgi:hypothetical protein
MVATILFLLGLVSAGVALGVVLFQQRQLSTGVIVVEEGFNGPEQVRRAFLALLRIFLRRTVIWRKLLYQYLLHIGVRALFYLDKITTDLYARSRNMFVKSAVKNKGTVPHFWEHLKVYKQEIDREKEENE